MTTFEEFVSNISFRHMTPLSEIPRSYYRISRLLGKLNVSMESFITHLPYYDYDMKEALHEVSNVPRMSTLAIGAIINYGVHAMDPGVSFLNVGVWNGFTFLSGLAGNPEKKCIGIDNFSEFYGPKEQFLERFNRIKSNNHFFYDMDYEEYFKEYHQGEIGFYIYDGEHSYRNQLRGLEIAEPFFSQNAVILVDDTNWEDPRNATMDFIRESQNRYRIVFDQRTHENGHPTYWNGILILRRET